MGQGFAECRDMDFPRECEDPCALQALGRALAGAMTDGGVVGLDGELGAGKTEFVKGLADGLGCEDIVTSPTFTLLHEYRASAATLYHLDFYRIERAEEIIAVGWYALLEEPGAARDRPKTTGSAVAPLRGPAAQCSQEFIMDLLGPPGGSF